MAARQIARAPFGRRAGVFARAEMPAFEAFSREARAVRYCSARGPAKAFRRTIHRMVRLHCLLTFSGGTLRVPFLRGQPRAPRFFEKNRVKLLCCATLWLCEHYSREASAERDAFCSPQVRAGLACLTPGRRVHRGLRKKIPSQYRPAVHP